MDQPGWNDIQIRAEKQLWGRDIELLIFCEASDRKSISVAKAIELEPLGHAEYATRPTLTLKAREAQALMDNLWQCGLRPSEGTGSAGSLAATERHLSDMRSIALGLLKKDGMEAQSNGNQ